MVKDNLYTTDCIRTNSGIYINVFEPTPEMININDIAHSLSRQCRFGGHLRSFYTVAQHCVSVSNLLPPELKLQGLLHDAAEAYLLDIPSPIKKRMPEYKKIENSLMSVIADRFGLVYPFCDIVKVVDKKVLEKEWNGLVINNYKICLSMDSARDLFIQKYNSLV